MLQHFFKLHQMIRIFCNVAPPNLANNSTLFIMILCEILGGLLSIAAESRNTTQEDEVVDMVTYPPIFVRSGPRPFSLLTNKSNDYLPDTSLYS